MTFDKYYFISVLILVLINAYLQINVILLFVNFVLKFAAVKAYIHIAASLRNIS